MAKRVIDENQISEQDIIGGSSLGGMVALEIANVTNAAAVVLIGSAMHAGEVQPLLTLLSPLAALSPLSIVQTLAGKHNNVVSAMFAEADPEFIRAMCSYLPAWQGCSKPMARIYRVHGKKDHVIPCPTTNCDVIEDAGHLLAITHTKEVAVFLEKVWTEINE